MKLRTKTTFQKRAELLETSKMTQKVFKLMAEKKTNLCVAADVETAEELLKIAEQVAPYVCILKTHIDAVSGVTDSTIQQLQILAKQYNFLIMEDRYE